MVCIYHILFIQSTKFYSSVRLDIRRTGSVKDGENIIGNETRVKVVKNKFKTINNKTLRYKTNHTKLKKTDMKIY